MGQLGINVRGFENPPMSLAARTLLKKKSRFLCTTKVTVTVAKYLVNMIFLVLVLSGKMELGIDF
jgi:hypothetical protein